MLNQIKAAWQNFPRQYWLLVGGSLLSATGGAMIWPFLTIYLRQRLDLPMTTVASLLTINAATSLISSFIAGMAADRFGRKHVMSLSLLCGALYYGLLGSASTFLEFALLMGFWGAASALYPVGANAMVADLVADQDRVDAYSFLRMVHNVGVAVGPIAGGILIAASYNVAFAAAGAFFGLYALINIFFIRETLTRVEKSASAPKDSLGGYGRILQDRIFVWFVLAFTFTMVTATLMFVMLPVYANENFNVPESQYGYIVTVNALMCIFVQYFVTQLIKKRPPLPVLAVGALFYALGAGSVAFGTNFWAFVVSMVILTIGELIMTPTATSLTAQLAPEDMRGRYMSVYSLTWPLAAGFGPIFAGLLNDNIAPVAMWYGGLAVGLLGVGVFLILSRRFKITLTHTPLS